MAKHKYNLPKSYLSPSAISKYLKCPRQYMYAYVLNERTPPGAAMLTGTALHAGFEMYYKDRIAESANPLTPSQTAEFAVSQFEEEIVNKDAEVKVEEKDSARRDIETIADAYLNTVAPFVRPKVVEQEFVYESKCGVPILMYLDLIRGPNVFEEEINSTMDTNEGPPFSEIIVDYKITKKKWVHNTLADSLQFNIYSLATGVGDVEIHNATKGTKKVVKRVSENNPGKKEDWVQPVHDVANNVRLLRNNFDGREHNHIETLIESVADSISKGSFPPCEMDSWMCSEKWCGYWHLCRGKR